eukprot:Hpha_TRINITY_DN14982_c4_g9::TRINITY_DN14982_c4_g9_i1::g.143369::m.143369/K00844/HK; hexokinase
MAANRLNVLAGHLPEDTRIARPAAVLTTQNVGRDSIEKLKVVYDLACQFDLSTAKLNQIMVHFISDLWTGLQTASRSSFKMLPSYVYRGETGVSGNFLALDLGGTNFRVLATELKNGKVVKNNQQKFQVPEKLMHATSTDKELFDFIADCIHKFLDSTQTPVSPLGFTFSFPVSQTALNAGRLITWTKGFSTAGCEGQDVVELLQAALKRNGLDIPVVALCNDTVGTLVAGYFGAHDAEIGVILGTGSNACYWEKVGNITKLPSPAGWNGRDEMCVNIEWGGFDSGRREVLPYTQMDDELDHKSPNPGFQRYEKMMSGMYLGEIGRCVLLYLVQHGIIGPIPSVMGPWSLESAIMSQMLSDQTPDYALVRKLLFDVYQYKATTHEAAIVKRLFHLIAMRSAKLAAAGIVAILIKQGKTKNSTVCIDGSVFEKTPGYKETLQATVDDLMQHHGHSARVNVVLQHGGSGIGAALIAALAK